jgi:hypothetical protein
MGVPMIRKVDRHGERHWSARRLQESPGLRHPAPTEEFGFASAQILAMALQGRSEIDQPCLLQTFELLSHADQFVARNVGHRSDIDGPVRLAQGRRALSLMGWSTRGFPAVPVGNPLAYGGGVPVSLCSSMAEQRSEAAGPRRPRVAPKPASWSGRLSDYQPTAPSTSSLMRSACPLCLAYSSIMCV